MSEQLLQVHALSRDFGGLRALNKVSFEVPHGALMGLIGPNGAGKTTLLNIISGHIRPSGGKIYFHGHSLDGVGAAARAALGIGRTFQQVQLFTNMSVVDNVMAGCYPHTRSGLMACGLGLPQSGAEEKNSLEMAWQLLARFHLEHRAFSSPASLPFKEQRLLEIARALAGEPELLLLDEPAAGFSSQEIEELVQVIATLKDRGITLLLVEHRMDLVMRVAEGIVVLNYGEKMAEGKPQEIQNNEMVLAAYLGEDFERM